VLVELTVAGRVLFDQLRAEFRALLHEDMATLEDEDVEALARAVEILDEMIDRLECPRP
jgi:DNA-binding MarR family transcriptional regulator